MSDIGGAIVALEQVSQNRLFDHQFVSACVRVVRSFKIKNI